MEFKLNEYHRNVPDEEFITDVKLVCETRGLNTITAKEYSKYGKYHSSTITRRFGSWKTVLELAGLQVKGHNWRYTMSDEDVIEDVRRVAKIYGKETITQREYSVYGKYYGTTLMKRYNGSWNRVLELCGMEVNVNRDISDEDLFTDIERVWILLGRQPTVTDINKGISKYALNTFARRFGGWRGALEAFVDYINNDTEDSIIETDYPEESTETITNHEKYEERNQNDKLEHLHKTKREVNLRLRFLVMQRDNFKCCICGASPAKDPSVELHIDHIVPWSKGGETTMDNLQTLCSKCNLGKSDLM